MSARKAAGHARKHVSSRKHAGTGKHHPTAHKGTATRNAHHVTAKAKHATHAKGRGFAVAEFLPVCSLEAVAMGLRLAGQPVSADEVAWLWELYGELSIPQALDVFAEIGALTRMQRAVQQPQAEAFLAGGQVRVLADPLVDGASGHALILGVDVPGPHAVLATSDGWWSWGELHSPWPCRIEEAWAVSWA